MTRSCPQCSSALQPRLHHGVELDVCLACKGVWFDATELSEALLGPAKRPTAYTVLFDESKLQPIGTRARVCPACSTESLTRAIWGRVTAAKCLACRGIWISAPSLRHLRSQLAELEASKDRPSLAGAEKEPGWGVGIEVLQVLVELLL